MLNVVATRKPRIGQWYSMGTGNGSVQDNNDDDTDDSGSHEDADADPQHRIQQLSQEAARRRRQAREWRQRAEAAEAKLAGDGTSQTSGPRVDVIMAMVKAGMTADRIEFISGKMDWDDVGAPEDFVEDLRDQFPFLFTSLSEENQTTTGRTAPAMNNGRLKPGRETRDQRAKRLARKFPALNNRGLFE